MRVALSTAAALTAIALVSATEVPVVPMDPVCSEEQLKASTGSPLPRICALEYLYGACDDECLAAYQKRQEVSLNCTRVEGSSSTMYYVATSVLDACVDARKNPKKIAYTPQLSVGLRVCTDAEVDAWDDHYKFHSLPPEGARNDTDAGCTDVCLHAREQRVLSAPPCWSETVDAWNGEYLKPDLLECIEERGESAAGNAALNSVMGGDGKLKGAESVSAANGTSMPSASDARASRVASCVVVGAAMVAAILRA